MIVIGGERGKKKPGYPQSRGWKGKIFAKVTV
jgi:hypothetical protein